MFVGKPRAVGQCICAGLADDTDIGIQRQGHAKRIEAGP
jgi:hypothetical protein